MIRSILQITCSIVLLCCNPLFSQVVYNEISVEDFITKKNSVNSIIIDVRTPQEYEQGHIQNAINFDWNDKDFLLHLDTIEKSQTIYIYCLSGGRSKKAAATLANEGFTSIFEISGGMMAWRAKGFHEVSTTSIQTGLSLDEYKLLTTNRKLVLIDFYATWCAPCKLMEPYLTRIANNMSETVTVIRIDADKNKELCKALEISALPVVKLYKEGIEIWNHEGFVSEETVLKQLN
jgi:thioredoxin 1